MQPRNSQPDKSDPSPPIPAPSHPGIQAPPPQKKQRVAGVLDEPYSQLNPLSVVVVAVEARQSGKAKTMYHVHSM
jgi:hypothetical protein